VRVHRHATDRIDCGRCRRVVLVVEFGRHGQSLY
jgi:hypothetical protein